MNRPLVSQVWVRIWLQLLTQRFTADPFNATELNPTMTNALDSSLWELYTQKNHYHSAVSTLARIFEEVFTKPNYALEDFLDHTYSTVRPNDAVKFYLDANCIQ